MVSDVADAGKSVRRGRGSQKKEGKTALSPSRGRNEKQTKVVRFLDGLKKKLFVFRIRFTWF